MANHKSAIKRNRQTEKRYARNKVYRTQLKTATKKVLVELEAKDKVEAEKELQGAIKVISKVASKGVIHKRTASRKISGLAKKVHQLSASA
ncbi:MAG: 30S ribosomal protein S20 [Nitrospinae bacterium]|nr:30S ribosomal protein S20 [Nitrospinota bacterium]MDA1109405.1 30S ribosomal protein S20 [Nitrospinota bacterium]